MASQRYLQLAEQFKNTSDTIEKIDLLIEMGTEARNYDTDQAMEISIEIIECSQKENYLLGIGRGKNLKGSVHVLQGDYDLGLKYLDEAYDIARQLNNQSLKARVENNIGTLYHDQGDFATALTHYERALEINESIGATAVSASNLNSIASLWYELGDYDTALEYALKCVPILEEEKSQFRLVAIYNTLGNIYFKKELFDEANQYFNLMISLAEEHSSFWLLALSGIGKVEFKLGQYDKAEKTLKKCLVEADEKELVEVQIICRFYLGKLYLEEESYRKARNYFLDAFDMAKNYARKHDMLSLHEALSAVYDYMGNIPEAFNHLKQYEKFKEEVFQQTTFNKLRNIQIRQETELAKKEKEVAERTARLKQQFMANMSHEIRTPMNAIVGMTNLLLNNNPLESQLKYLKAIQQSADNLLVIINDILDLSKIEAGKIVIEKIPFGLSDLMHNIKEMLLFKADEKNLDFEMEIDDQIPDHLIGDPTRINQVLVNLLGNAIKFTDKGKVGLFARMLEDENHNTIQIKFDVIDTGIGISKEYVNKIFDSFTQAGSDTARKYGGTGLGLTISKQMTDLMNGVIEVQSELGKGTIFSVTLPLEVNHNPNFGNEEKVDLDELKKELSGCKILLVEDNEFNKMVAEDTLRDLIMNVDLSFAENGIIAVEKASKEFYDIILMDIQMPIMNGIEATEAIRAFKNKHASQKIVAMTANVLQEDVKHYFEVGMDGYISKPFKTEDLLKTLVSVKHQRNNNVFEDTHTNTNIQGEEIVLPKQLIDLSFLKQLTGESIEKRQKYVQMFLDNAPKLLRKIDEGYENDDLESVKVAAHSLKPQLSYMGVKEEFSNIYLLEKTAGSNHKEKLPSLIKRIHKVCDQVFEELSKETGIQQV